jgi:isoquinoline 1-oxidoreductase beta subunit
VLEAAANAAGWTAGARTRSSTTGRGIAIGTAFGSLVAQVVEVQKTARGGMRVARVTVAIDCYLPVNPGSIEAQVIGGVVHAMNATLYGRQTFANGAAQVKNFNRSRMIRLAEMPTVNVVVLPPPAQADRNIAIGGVGELGVPTFAPALANAWAALTGQRLRTLPFYPDATMSDG